MTRAAGPAWTRLLMDSQRRMWTGVDPPISPPRGPARDPTLFAREGGRLRCTAESSPLLARGPAFAPRFPIPDTKLKTRPVQDCFYRDRLCFPRSKWDTASPKPAFAGASFGGSRSMVKPASQRRSSTVRCTVGSALEVALLSTATAVLPTQHGHCSFVIVDLGLSCVNSHYGLRMDVATLLKKR